ncbi:MAG TPA: type IX secretion system outer membrane channel protein PorV [Flavobacteriia bacterium]|nr:type IX secretion system outer membrane channel protein PorV [Flavobacteriia bacterium]
MKKIFLATLVIAIFNTQQSKAQSEITAITTAAPFLLISPDARSGGLGDMGVATSSDAYSQHYNAAKLAFLESEFTVGVSYTPWLRQLTNDVFLGNVTFANKLNERSAWGASLNYFSLGSIQLTDELGTPLGVEKPNDLAIDGSYALKLNDGLSMAVTLRYIRSDLSIKIDNSELKTVNTFAVDLGTYYQSEETNYGDFNGRWRAGASITNMGPRVEMRVGGNKSFIPTNLRLGGGFDFILDDMSTIRTGLETTKLLVPSPQRDVDGDGNLDGKNNDVDFFTGMFQSFNDAPGGFKEELKEFTWSASAEYEYDQTFAFRLGYFHESELKGARKFFTLGAGFKFKSSKVDVSYLMNSTDVKNPLENTLRFSISFDFGDFFEEF